jgi:hypothetical protein
MAIQTSIISALEVALNDAIRLFMGIDRATGSYGTIPYNTIVFNAIISRFYDRSSIDPVSRAVMLDSVSVGLFSRSENSYEDDRELILDASEHLISCLRRLKSGGISGTVLGKPLNNAFAGLTLVDNALSVETIRADNKSVQSTAYITFSSIYEYLDFTDVNLFWDSNNSIDGGLPPVYIPGSVIVNEFVTGIINGVNATFTTGQPFVPETLEVFWNGQKLDPDQYTNIGNATIQLAFSPPIGSIITSSYWTA